MKNEKENYTSDDAIEQALSEGSDNHQESMATVPHVSPIQDDDTNDSSQGIVVADDYNESVAAEEGEAGQINDHQSGESDAKAFSQKYFEEEILSTSSDDSVIDASEYAAIIEQQEGIVSYRIEGIEDSKGNVKSKKELQVDPPILVVESSNGDAANFLLTKELTRKLADSMEIVYENMSGVKKSKVSTDKEIMEWISTHKIKTGVLVLVMLLVLFGIFTNS